MRKQELVDVWTELDRDDQDMLLDFAYKLRDRPVLKGGPYDGLRLDPLQEFGGWVNASHGGGVAVYVNEDDFSECYVFAGFRNTGEGVVPDVYPNRGGE